MADPPTVESIERTTEALNNNAAAAEKSANMLSNFSNIGSAMQGIFSELGTKINGVATALTQTEGLSTRAAAGFTALSIGALGVRESFSKGFDVTHLNTFSGQLQSILGVMGVQGTKNVGTLTNLFTTAFGAAIPAGIKRTATELERFILDTAASADNALRLQNALFRMGAVTGGLNKIIADAGDGFENMNNVLMQHQKMVTDVAEASGNSAETIEEYYVALGQVPKALESQVTSSRDANVQISMLDATMQYSVGSGREFKDVVEDLTTAYNKMGMEGEVALKFTARMGEISNKYGVELKDVKSALTALTNDMKNFGGEGMRTGQVMEGVVKIMNNYLGALKSTGVSGSTAVGMIQNMTGAMIKLDVAQRAFLSQQSGGGGGLRGAFQIEQMIREGKGAEVMAQMQKSIEQMTGGRMVSVKEAAGSEEAANRAIMQRQMIMSGPLGALAGDEQGAARIAEMFAAKTEGKITGEELATDVLQKPMEAGLKFQETSATHLGVIRSLMEGARGVANVNALSLTQTMGAARVGTLDYRAEGAGGVVAAEEEARQNNIRFRTEAGARGGARAGNIAAIGTASENAVPVMQQATAELGQSLGSLIQGLGPAFRAPVERIKRLVESGEAGAVQAAEAERQRQQDEIAAIREKWNRQVDSSEKTKALEEASQRENALAVSAQYAASTERLRSAEAERNAAGTMSPPTTAMTNEYSVEGSAINPNFNTVGARTPGQRVGVVATNVAVTGSQNAAETATEGPGGNTEREPVEVDVKVTGICIDCGRKMKENPYITPATR